MKTLKRIALIMVSVMMLLGVSAFAKESPIKTSFNAALKQSVVTYDGKTHKPSVVVTDINGKKIASKAQKQNARMRCGKNALTVS